MNHYARIVSGVVAETISLDAGLVPGVDVFTPDFARALVPCAADIAAGWAYDGVAFTPPPPPAAPSPTDLLDHAKARQIALRDGGLTVDVGTSAAPHVVDVASDVDGRSLVSGCVQLVGLAAQNGQPAPTFPWVNDDGAAATLTAAQILTIGYRLGAFVQATYATLGTVCAGITAGTISGFNAIDKADWPSPAA